MIDDAGTLSRLRRANSEAWKAGGKLNQFETFSAREMSRKAHKVHMIGWHLISLSQPASEQVDGRRYSGRSYR